MSEEKLKALFAESLNIPVDDVSDELRYNETPQWDSVAHMALIAAIEQAYDILIETDDIIDMSSFAKARAIVAKYEAQ